jgi:hypothetical protein
MFLSRIQRPSGWLTRLPEKRKSGKKHFSDYATNRALKHASECATCQWRATLNSCPELGRVDFAVPVSAKWDGGVLMNQFPLAVSSLEAIRFAYHEAFRIARL